MGLQDGIMGCYAPKELERLNKVWAVCNRVPEDLHPKSFRSTFAQKTTIWATAKKNASSVSPTSPCGPSFRNISAGFPPHHMSEGWHRLGCGEGCALISGCS